MSDKPEKKKIPMTSSDADRIEDSNTDPGFKKRARDAADRNEEQTDKPEKKKIPMTSSDADRIEDSNTDPGFKKRARDAADRNEEQTK